MSAIFNTRELFEERFLHVDEKFRHVDEKFRHVDEKFRHLEEKMDERFKSMQNHFKEHFKRTDFKFHVLFGISVIGFTVLNPDFLDLIKLILK